MSIQSQQNTFKLFLALFLIGICFCQGPPPYPDWKRQYGIDFGPGQDNYRQALYISNLAKINAHNSDPSSTYTQGVNQFTGYTQEQFVAMMLAARPPSNEVSTTSSTSSTSTSGGVILLGSVPPVNWTSNGYTTTVKNQGGCGSCWAFSAVAALESANLIQKNLYVDLSQQQLVDCSSGYGNAGCNGGWPSSAMNYIIAKKIATEAKYPYAARTQRCKTTTGTYTLASYLSLPGCSNLLVEIYHRPFSV